MMDFSFLSTHDSSMRFDEKSQSQNFEIDCAYNEYYNIAEYQPSSKIVEICSEFKEITKNYSEDNNYLTMIQRYLENLSKYLDHTLKNMSLLPKNCEGELYLSSVLIGIEIKTWKLIHGLYEDRFNYANIESTLSVARSTESELIRDLYKQNATFREAQVVVDWLELYMKEKVEKDVNFLMGAHGKSWEHTKHIIQRRSNFSTTNNIKMNELDPDAPLRGNLILSDSDKNDENEYLRYLYHCIQSGDWDKAQSLCQNHEELWRALSLEGWKPFHNVFIKYDSSYNGDIVGNSNRSLFKSVCWTLSEDSQLNIYERAIYAIFCGNISVLSLVEVEWDGLLWAHFKVYIESIVDDYLHTFTLNGSFGTQSLFGRDDFDYHSLGLLNSSESTNVMTHSSREQIFDDIAAKLVHSPMEIIKCGGPLGSKMQLSFYKSIFEMVQQFVITNDVEGLIFYIDISISKLSTEKSASDKLILRFLTHLIIFIYSIHVDMKMDVYHKVLECYIETLISDRSLYNISFYISKLSTDLQIKWFCEFMKGITDYNEKRRCIFEGLGYDLPIIEISQLVVQNIRLKIDPTEVNNLRSFSSNVDEPMCIRFVNDYDKVIINSLDWLTFIPQQYCHLVREANAFCRKFLESDKLQAAKMVLLKTSNDIICQVQNDSSMNSDILWLSAAIYENRCLKAFIASYDSFGDWYNNYSTGRPEEKNFKIEEDLNKLSFHEKQMLQKQYEDYNLLMKQWESINRFNANKVMDMFMNTLKMGENGWLSEIGFEHEWMVRKTVSSNEEHDDDNWTLRSEQIERLQTKNIVNMCFLLMKVLTSSDMNERCFELVDLLANKKLALSQYFEKSQLQRLLQQVRQCSLNLLSDGKDPLGISN